VSPALHERRVWGVARIIGIEEDTDRIGRELLRKSRFPPRGLPSQQTVTWYEKPEASFDTCSLSFSSRLVGRQQKSGAHPRHPPRSGDDGR
jgi:hypothetical protein